ncbi:NAD(P)H-quinone oxidoreductase subunit U, chloroplastic [Aristolochia californica]|uniref:NAD(P)H-quinone oxidoreductase subunit U, chloroplastic n=1 Tax=Aristolochia californica TaxID=171875 RepID=UPI0035D648AA
MALFSTTSVCISRSDPLGIHSPLASKSLRLVPCSVRFLFSPRKLYFSVQNSAEAASETASVEENPLETAPVETSKGLSSLISVTNVEKALRGIAITSVDHYARLGIPRGTSYKQVIDAYKQRCEELMDRGLEEEELNKEMELIKESYAILSSEEERRLYDWSLARSEMPDRYVWPFEVDITQTPTQPPPPKEPEDVIPTRILGYVLFGWLILSFVLSIALK